MSVHLDVNNVPTSDESDTPTSTSQEVEKDTTADDDTTIQYPAPLALFFLMTAISISVSLTSLDRTIITTAIPHITDQFHSYNDVGWYASAYLITACSFLPTYGRIYGMVNSKWTFLSGLFVFEVGSLICGVTPSSKVLIVGRAIAGVGSAGVVTGAYVVVARSVPLQKRPLYAGIVAMMFGVGAVAGPILGGAFTDRATWRWCFYFNLPLGGLVAAATILFFKPQEQLRPRSLTQIILELDIIGNAILLATAVMFFLAMQYSAQSHAWHTSRVIGLLVGAGVGFVLFLIWQWHKGDRALIPLSIILQRNVAAGCINTFFIYAALLSQAYYLPVWFQACRDKSALGSGVEMIPFLLGNSLFAILVGAFVSKVGYFKPPAILGSAIATVGSALLSTLAVDTASSKWIGYEVLTSVGLGMAVQQGYVAVQSVVSVEQLAVASALISAFQSLGGAISVSVGNTVLLNELYDAALPGVDIDAVIAAGATGFRTLVPEERIPELLSVYNEAFRKVFLIGIVCSGLAFVAALGLEWKSIKSGKGDVEALDVQSVKELQDSV
ncbi:MAG: hypothetical protein ASARMPREDX12_005442 [Alectoria sarmentosa]|nr:MAG: hypothetical protein ASARMPREDX12_005442 [Alectoria sarmentosa]